MHGRAKKLAKIAASSTVPSMETKDRVTSTFTLKLDVITFNHLADAFL